MNPKQDSYSQSGEDLIICRELESIQRGTFLDIGAYHPFTFSNTRRLYELGFKGVFVEPSPSLRGAFEEEYQSDPSIVLLPVCVGESNGIATLWDSGGDAISSLNVEETKKWTEAYGTKFTPIEVEILTVAELLHRCPYRKFDFVNIDTEGNVWEIVRQFDFQALACTVVCLEWNGRDAELYLKHLGDQGYREIHRNHENLIFKAI
jgi:FkbM family methyltransferase